MNTLLAVLVVYLFSSAGAQQRGKLVPEIQPRLNLYTCTKVKGCVPDELTVTVDANWRSFHTVDGADSDKCLKGAEWDPQLCPDGLTCAKSCALEGVNYERDIGVTSTGDTLKIMLVTPNSNGKNIGARLYVLDKEGKYMQFKLKGYEVSFDILTVGFCGTNAGVYMAELEPDGGSGRFPSNAAGSVYGEHSSCGSVDLDFVAIDMKYLMML